MATVVLKEECFLNGGIFPEYMLEMMLNDGGVLIITLTPKSIYD